MLMFPTKARYQEAIAYSSKINNYVKFLQLVTIKGSLNSREQTTRACFVNKSKFKASYTSK